MTATEWIERYKTAWASNAPDDIRALFSLDATYSYRPNDPRRVRGVDDIAASWIESKDDPGDCTFEYWVLSETGELAIVQGVTDYTASGGLVYDNLWVIRWGADERADDFTEWYIARE